MKKSFKFPLYAALSLAVACGFTSCDNNDDLSDPDQMSERDKTFQTIAQQYLDHTVYVTYEGLASETEQLVKDLQTLKAEKTDDNVKKVCETFLEARAWWEKSEAFLYGAATDFGIDPHIDSWPLDKDNFLKLFQNSAMIDGMAGEDGDVYAGDNFSNALLGFHGIEYIIFENGAPKAAADISDIYMTYAIAVAGDLRNKCFQLEVSWIGEANSNPAHYSKVVDELELPVTMNNGSLSYGENMMKAGNAGSTYASWANAMEAIVDGCKTIADEVGTSKIGKPAYGEDVNYIESPYSHKSIQDFYDNMISIQNSYMGGIEGQRDESKSLHAYVKSQNADLDKKVTDAIDNALTKISSMKAPFVENYSDQSAKDASAACQELDKVLSEVKTLLGAE